MIVSFHNELDIRWRNDIQEWEMLSPLWCNIDERRVIIPKGFTHDLSSIPRILRSIIPQIGPQNRASVLHDYLYSNHEPRAYADRAFLAGMKFDGVGYFRRWTMYCAVRAAGWVKYV